MPDHTKPDHSPPYQAVSSLAINTRRMTIANHLSTVTSSLPYPTTPNPTMPHQTFPCPSMSDALVLEGGLSLIPYRLLSPCPARLCLAKRCLIAPRHALARKLILIKNKQKEIGVLPSLIFLKQQFSVLIF